jgi:hypothetical protein
VQFKFFVLAVNCHVITYLLLTSNERFINMQSSMLYIMAKIKTLVENLGNGYESAFDSLDKRVENLGEVEIKDVKDTAYPLGTTLSEDASKYIERIVIYDEKHSGRGKSENPFKLSDDTSLLEFVNNTDFSSRAIKVLKELYYPQINYKGKEMEKPRIKTIRELVPITYSTFIEYGPTVHPRLEVWKEIDTELRQHGYKLYNKLSYKRHQNRLKV